MARIMTLSDDEIETIRIHLSAIKEELCNQNRYDEATYYEKLIEKFLSSNVIRCKECKCASDDDYRHCKYVTWWNGPDDYCSRAKKRGDTGG